ncbi:MAG: hypothetical protein IPL89_07100 [Acidobacteria bacterium]|nr:hypothetical protein [Acidobacteriota bacterium]
MTLSIVLAYAAKLFPGVGVERTSRAPDTSPETPRARTTRETCVMPSGGSVYRAEASAVGWAAGTR